MKTMFDIIKKQNGDHFAKAIRAYDNGIFDIPNLDKIVQFAGHDAEPIMNYLVSRKNIKITKRKVHQNPIKLLNEAGYTAYYANTLKKQNWPKQFYAEGEELCTFDDPERYKNYHIIVAIKKNVLDIKRENFPYPEREDAYGTSVLQIQILKSGGFISIKNRYNHAVDNPDNTFNSNPDNIIEGLSDAIKHHYHVDFSSKKVKLPENYALINDQIINYNYEVNNVYFGENFYAHNGKIFVIDKQKELMLDYFVLNLHDKTIFNYSKKNDGFLSALQEEIKDKKLQISVNQQGNKCLLANGNSIIELNHGKIKALAFDLVNTIDNNFLYYNQELKKISLANATKIGDNFLCNNNDLTDVFLPKASFIGEKFLYWNQNLSQISLPKATHIGGSFMFENKRATKVFIPQAVQIKDAFLFWNEELSKIDLPHAESLGDCFLFVNRKLEHFYAPKLAQIGKEPFHAHPQQKTLLQNKGKPMSEHNHLLILQKINSNTRL